MNMHIKPFGSGWMSSVLPQQDMPQIPRTCPSTSTLVPQTKTHFESLAFAFVVQARGSWRLLQLLLLVIWLHTHAQAHTDTCAYTVTGYARRPGCTCAFIVLHAHYLCEPQTKSLLGMPAISMPACPDQHVRQVPGPRTNGSASLCGSSCTNSCQAISMQNVLGLLF